MNKCCNISGRISGAQKINAKLDVGVVAGVQSVFQFNTKFDFPTLGTVNALYIATSENAAYRWNETDLHYYCIGRDYLELKIISGGNADGE